MPGVYLEHTIVKRTCSLIATSPLSRFGSIRYLSVCSSKSLLVHPTLSSHSSLLKSQQRRTMTDTTTPAEESARRFKIYTRTGDKGTSALYTGERRSKDDLVFEALGTTDELSSMLGLARDYCNDAGHKIISTHIQKIQCLLQDVGSNIATPRSSSVNEFKRQRTVFDEDGSLVQELESWIDTFDTELPPLRNFILPSGGKTASTLHVARSICRRAERRIVPLVQAGDADASTAKYVNRLSDYLFTAARYAALKENKEEVIYIKFDSVKLKSSSTGAPVS